MAFWKRNTTGGKSSSHAHRASLIQALEPRMMFDASVPVVADQAAQAVEAAGQHDGVAKDTSSAAAAPAATTTTDSRHEVVFVDGNVQDYKQLTSQLPKGSEVVVLDPSKNGLQQMADYLKGRTDLDAIHLISHGGEASVQIGSTRLTLDNVDSMKAQLEQIGASLGANGDLLIYGCDVAKGTDGSALLSKLAGYTDADVAASTDWSGDASKGGDWVLEAATGAIESKSVLAGVSYDHVLNTLNAGDIVVLGWNALSDTITLATLVDIPAGTVIKFTDKGWDQASNAFTSTSTGDGTITWTTTGTIAAGTRLSLFFGGSDQANTLTNVSTGADLSGQITATTYTVTDPMNLAGDGLFIYQDTDTNPYFIFGFNNSGGTVDANGWNTSIAATLRDSMLPNGANSQNVLTSGVNAVGIPGGGAAELDNIQYTGPITAADRATWLARVTNSANWTGDNTGAITTGVGSTVSVNVVPEVVSIVFADNSLNIGQTSLVTFTFNQAVTNFSNADLTVSNGTLSAVSSSDGGTTWTATFTPNSSVTSASNVITLDKAGVTSVSTGTAGSGISTSSTYSVDTVRPTATITVASATLTANNTSTVNITFSEAVSGFSLADMSASNGTLSNLSTSDNIHWTAILTPNAGNTSNGNIIILDNSLYTDASGNTGAGVALSNLYAVDTQRPTASIAVSNTSLNIGGSSLVTITFSEAVTAFSLADLTASNGTLSNLTTSDNIIWTATLTPTNGVTHSGDVVTLNNSGVTDLVGNAGTGTTSSNTYSVDTQRPTATIVFANPNIGVGQTSQVTITFSEAVSDFTNDDLTVSNGTLSTVSSSDGGITWVATFTPTAGINSASNHVILDNTGVTDGAGNAGSGTTVSNNYAVDGVRPTATVTIDKSSLIIGQTAQVTITFSEAVTNFSNSDLTVSGGSLSAVSSSNGGVTWTATFTPTGNITSVSNVITLDNTGYTDTAGNIGTGTSVSNNYAIDTQRPTATIVMSDPTLRAGETSQVTITFSEAVSGLTLADLSAAHGVLSNLSSSDGGITWTATFTPDANTNSATNVVSLANTGIADIAGNSGAGTTNSVNFTIDTVRPSATIVVANPALKIGDTSQVTITFSQAVSGFTNADLTVVGGTLSAVSSADGGITWSATFTPAGNISNAVNHITLNNSGVNAASSGNAGTGLTTSNNYVIDTQRPTATIVVADNQLGIGGSSQVTITFSEAVTGFSLADLTSDNGTLSNLSTSDNITWTATLTAAVGVTAGNNHINLNNTGVMDVAGNAGSGSTNSNTYAVDSIRPTATIVVGDATLSAGESTTVTVTFSEAVTGLDNTDLSVPNGTLGTLSSSDGGITWTATYTPNTNVRDTSNVITLNNTGYTDLAGNAGIGVTNSANFTIDTVRPTATIVVSSPTLNVGSTSQVTITFSEAVTGFTNADLTVEQGTLSAVSSSDGGVTWTATFTPSVNVTDTTNVISLDNSGVQNASGNAGSGTTTSNNYAIDTQRPTATITVANPNLGIGQTSTVTIAFNEEVAGFSLADLSVANGVLSNLSSSDGGKTWTATLTPTATITDPTNLIVLDTALVSDAFGNAGAGIALSNNYAIDTERPTASIVLADPALKAGETSLVTITFSEKVIGFSNADLVVSSGTLSAVSSSDGGKTWTATFTPTAEVSSLNNVISLDNTGYTDLAGNSGTGVTDSANYSVETRVPTSTIVVAQPALKAGETSVVTITFSEAVTGFTLADLNVDHGTLSGLSSSDGGITWTATFSPSTDVTDASNHISLDNSGVTSVSGNAGRGTTVSNGYAIDTARPTATITVSEPSLSIGQSSQVTITFSEAVSGFDNADLSVANGSLSAVTSSDGGLTWTATFTPNDNVTDASSVIVLNNTGYTDAAGNTGVGTTTSAAFAIDTQRPSATIVVANSDLRPGQSSQVTITFSEAVTGLELSDLSASNATLSGLSSSDGGITWTATLTPLANVIGSSNLVTLNNLGFTDAAGNTGIGVSQSNNYAVNNIAQTGDPQYRAEQGLQPVNASQAGSAQPLTVALQNAGAPSLGSMPLLDSSNRGSAQTTLGSLFREGPSQSQIALIFSNNGNNAFGDGSGSGFLGFGGGDGGVFGTSTLGAIFDAAREGDEQALSAFGQRQGGVEGGLSGVFASSGLGQQLQEMNQREQRQVADLARAFGELGQERPAS